MIPVTWATTAGSTWSVLMRANTFADVRTNAGAWLLVDNWLPGYLEREEQEGRTVTGADDEPFDAAEFFGPEDWRAWTPNARGLTTEFLLEEVPEAGEEHLRPDDGWGLLEYDSWPRIAPEDRGIVEAAVRRRGYEIKAVEDLDAMFLDPPVDPARAGADMTDAQSAPPYPACPRAVGHLLPEPKPGLVEGRRRLLAVETGRQPQGHRH